MNQHEINALRALWQTEEQAAFSGWDFSHLDGRWRTAPLPWDYKSVVLEHLKPDDRLLDMGTGGGEFLLSLGHPYTNTSVTEAWAPNVRLCLDRLAPLGVDVQPVTDDTQLPFEDNVFDIVINRHESYDVTEVVRVLKPGGLFITQQVGWENNLPLSKRLYPDYASPFHGFELSAELPKFEAQGLEVMFSDEAYPALRFFDVGAVVYYVKVIEWEYPDFSVERTFPQLCALQGELLEKGFIGSREHRFIVAARNKR